MYITIESCRKRPVHTFSITIDNNPITMPSDMLDASGIMIMVRNAGTDSVKSEKSRCTTWLSIITPTNTNAHVVAADGIIKNSGEKNSDTKKSIATANAVKPVLPPSAMPVVLST